MEIIAFKMDGLGNDFVIIDQRINNIDLSKEQILDLESRGIFFQENSPDEILDLTREMYERLNGLWNEKNDEKELMENFLKISNIYDSEGQKFPGRVCYNFLKKNKKFCEIFN